MDGIYPKNMPDLRNTPAQPCGGNGGNGGGGADGRVRREHLTMLDVVMCALDYDTEAEIGESEKSDFTFRPEMFTWVWRKNSTNVVPMLVRLFEMGLQRATRHQNKIENTLSIVRLVTKHFADKPLNASLMVSCLNQMLVDVEAETIPTNYNNNKTDHIDIGDLVDTLYSTLQNDGRATDYISCNNETYDGNVVIESTAEPMALSVVLQLLASISETRSRETRVQKFQFLLAIVLQDLELQRFRIGVGDPATINGNNKKNNKTETDTVAAGSSINSRPLYKKQFAKLGVSVLLQILLLAAGTTKHRDELIVRSLSRAYCTLLMRTNSGYKNDPFEQVCNLIANAYARPNGQYESIVGTLITYGFWKFAKPNEQQTLENDE